MKKSPEYTEGLDRVTDLQGGILADWISFDDAMRIRRAMDARGEGWKHERWGGERTGWNGVAAYFPPRPIEDRKAVRA